MKPREEADRLRDSGVKCCGCGRESTTEAYVFHLAVLAWRRATA